MNKMLDRFAKSDLLKRADSARDVRDWPVAAEHYTGYLRLAPKDAHIWVQLGHSLKESSDLEGAERAYRTALEIAPEIADTHLQLGHLLKIKRDMPGAIGAYQQAIVRDPTLLDATRELEALGIATNTPKLSRDTNTPAIVIDLSDVFFYLHHHPTVSGIQRVQLGISEALIQSDLMGPGELIFVVGLTDSVQYAIIEPVYLTALIAALSRDSVEHDRLKDLMQKAISAARAYRPSPRDTFLMLGAFWVLDNIIARMIDLKRRGVRLGILIHDIIPITHPEYCERSLTDTFKLFASTALASADFTLSVSEYSGAALKSFLLELGVDPAPHWTLPSAHITWDTTKAADSAESVELSELGSTPFVLYVSTIEIRKNHAYLFSVWKRLQRELGRNTPKLVLLGRSGWRVNDFMDQLRSTNYLNGSIVLLHGVSDAALARLYKDCLFTVFSSFEEGWGLAVGESLTFGKPCAASHIPPIREVGGEHLDYFDPLDVNSGYEVIKKLITDKEHREQRAKKIASEFAPRKWADVARDLICISRDARARVPQGRTMLPPELSPGRVYRFGHAEDMEAFVATGEAQIAHMAFDPHWYSIENFGRWMRGKFGSIEFRVMELSAEREDCKLFLQIDTVSWLADSSLEILVNDLPAVRLKLLSGQRHAVVIDTALLRGMNKMSMRVRGEIRSGNDPRLLSIGLVSFGYAPKSRLDSRVTLVEGIMESVAQVSTLTTLRHSN